MRYSIVALAAALLMLAGGAQAGLINYYSFNDQTLADEAPIYGQNTGSNATTGIFTGNLISYNTPGYPAGTLYGTFGAIYAAGNGRSYNPAQTGNYSLNIKNATQAPQTSEFKLPNGDADVDLGQNFTVEMWVNPGDTAGYTQQTTAKFLTATNYSISKTAYGNDGNVIAKVGTATVSGLAAFSASGWHHVALVANGGTATYYYDGVATSVGSTGTMGTNLAFAIGAATRSTVTYADGWDCYIDDLAMWNEALTAGAIATHAATGGVGYNLTIPEPMTMSLLALGGLGVLFRSRRKR